MKKEDLKWLRECLLDAIKGSGKNITQVALELGISRQSLSRKLNGRDDFKRKEMILFAKSVGCSPAQLFFSE